MAGQKSQQTRVREWIATRLGAEHATPKERAMRLLEESLELAQSEGVIMPDAFRLLQHVFNRPPGDPMQEAGAVGVCLMGYCAARNLDHKAVIEQELQRIEAKTISEVAASVQRKRAEGLTV